MKLNLSKILLASLIFINLSLCLFYVFKQDLIFSSDVARDFLIFKEIDTKHLVLIGPKSSVAGLFHGPLWVYLNYPAYLIGGGNPVVVEAFWLVIIALSLIPFYYIANKLFGKTTAYLFILMYSLYMFFHANNFINPVGDLFLIPINFYIFIRYLNTLKIKYLILYVFILGLLIQFEMALGVPFFILSLIYLAVDLFKKKKLYHLLAFAVILIPLSTFILFDVRHDFLMFHSLLQYLSPKSGDLIKYNPINLLVDRTLLLTTQVEFIRYNPNYRNLIVGLISVVFLFFQLKDKKYSQIYKIFLYFYVGFFVLTFINRGPILYFYFYPLFPLVFLMFCSFATSRYAKAFFVIFFIVYALNFHSALSDAKEFSQKSGNVETSWKFLKEASDKVFENKNFGYFVYTPDVIGYGPKYALMYDEKLHRNSNASYFQKKKVTYVLVATPALGNPYLSYTWWKENKLKIKQKPVSVYTFSNGYKWEKYLLSDEEIKIKPDSTIDPGLLFR